MMIMIIMIQYDYFIRFLQYYYSLVSLIVKPICVFFQGNMKIKPYLCLPQYIYPFLPKYQKLSQCPLLTPLPPGPPPDVPLLPSYFLPILHISFTHAATIVLLTPDLFAINLSLYFSLRVYLTIIFPKYFSLYIYIWLILFFL